MFYKLLLMSSIMFCTSSPVAAKPTQRRPNGNEQLVSYAGTFYSLPLPKAGTAHPFFDQFIKPGDLIFDVGANIGNKTVQYLAHGARVICFEPQPICVKQLEKRFAKNKDVTIVAKGIADKPGELELALCPRAGTLATFSQQEQIQGRFAEHAYTWTHKVMVPVTTLDAMIAIFGLPVFCKIDVENFELEVLQGLSKPIRCISFEYHQEFFNNAVKCIEQLQSIGYTKFNFTIAEELTLKATTWLSAQELIATIQHLYTDQDWSAIWGLWGDVYAMHE